MKRLLFGTILVAASLAAPAGWGQSFNVDLDIFFGPRSLGTGMPQPSFGGAASQPGYWNFASATGPGPSPLRDLAGNPTSVVWRAWGGWGSGGGWRNPRLDFGIVNDDFWLLMGDAAEIGSPYGRGALFEPPLIIYTFEGLEPGLYELFTYAVAPYGHPARVEVTVPGAATENPQVCTGPIRNDWTFLASVTHTVHRVGVDAGTLQIRVTGPPPHSKVNGFQIVKVK